MNRGRYLSFEATEVSQESRCRHFVYGSCLLPLMTAEQLGYELITAQIVEEPQAAAKFSNLHLKCESNKAKRCQNSNTL
jgi:hypothetical protein